MTMVRPLHGIFFCVLLALSGPSVLPAQTPSADDLFRNGQFTQARALYQAQALRLAAEAPWSRAQAEALFNLGAASAATGDLAESMLALSQSLAVFEKISPADNLDTALVLEGLASVLLQQDNLARAHECLDRALKVREQIYPEHHPQLARLYALMASTAQLSGDYAGTEDLYYKALMAYRKIHGNVHPIVGEVIQNIATFNTATGGFEAEIMYQQASDVAEALYGPWHPLRAVSQTNFGWLRWTQGRYDEAEQHLRRALEIHDHLSAGSHPDLAVCLIQLGRVLLAQGRPAEAAPMLERAAQVYEGAWWRAGAGAERSLAVLSPYPLLAASYLELDKMESALTAYRAHHGRLVSLSRRLQDLPGPLASRRDSLVSLLGVCEENLARLTTEDSDRAARARARAALAAAETSWRAFEKQATQQMVPEADGVFPEGYRSSSVEPFFGWLTVEIQPGQQRGWGFVLQQDQPVEWALLDAAILAGTSPVAAVAQALADIQQGSDETAHQLATLRRYAVEPLKAHWEKAGAVRVLPSGFMAGFPVELLLEGNQEVIYVPLLGEEAQARTGAPTGRDRRVLVLADPPFSTDPMALQDPADQTLPDQEILRSALAGDPRAIENLPGLAGTRREADALARLFPDTQMLLGTGASEKAMRALALGKDLGRFDIVHLATHALIDAERPERSALVLSQVDRQDDLAGDGLLTVREINRTWRLNAELVTLSACATGLGRRIDGEGFLGFTQSLLGAGAHEVMVTLWPVDDRATAMLMERFYANLAGDLSSAHLTPAQALAEARHWLRDYRTPAGSQPFAAPRYWAGFVLFGAGS